MCVSTIFIIDIHKKLKDKSYRPWYYMIFRWLMCSLCSIYVRYQRTFIYCSEQRDGGKTSNPKSKKCIIRKPNMDTEFIAKEILGDRQSCDVKEEDEKYSDEYGRTVPQPEVQSSGLAQFKDHVQTSSIDFVAKTGGTFKTASVKSFTPIELMERKLEAQHKELLSPPDNYRKYRGWRYDKRLKK